MTLMPFNKRGQTPITFVFTLIAFNLVWIFFLSKLLSIVGQQWVAAGATGLEALFASNLNMVVFVVQIIAIMAYGYWGNN